MDRQELLAVRRKVETVGSGQDGFLRRLVVFQVEELDRRFWIGYWDIYRLTRRGEVDRPFGIYIRLLADAILPLTAVLPADHPAARQLVAAEFSRQADHNMRALRRLLNDYVTARAAVVEAHQLAFQPNDAVERELTRIISS